MWKLGTEHPCRVKYSGTRAYVYVCVTPIINRWCLIFCHHICFWLCSTVTEADEMIQREREWRRDVYIKVIIICIKSTCLCKLNFRYYVLHLCGRCCECTRSFECVCVCVSVCASVCQCHSFQMRFHFSTK